MALPSARWEHGGVSDSTEPACGRCGYPARGLTTFICPECGSDLREVGIRTQAMRRAAGPIAIVVARTILVGVPALVITALVSGLVIERRASETRTFAPTFSVAGAGAPKPGTVDTLTVAAHGTRLSIGESRDETTPVDRATFVIHVTGHHPAALEVDVRRRRAMGEIEAGKTRSGELSLPLVLAWLTTAGMDPRQPQTRQLADDIVASADGLHAGRPEGVGFSGLESRGGGSSSGAGPSPVVVIALAFLWGLVWLLAVVRGLRGRV